MEAGEPSCRETESHHVLFLPKYTPDFNQIEDDFSPLKQNRIYAESGTYIDKIIRNYCVT